MADDRCHLKQYEAFLPLWKIDDPGWVQQRKAEWKIVKANYLRNGYKAGAKIFADYAHFYAYGLDAVSDFLGDVEWRIPIIERVCFTPWSTAEELVRLYEAAVFSDDKAKILHNVPNGATWRLEGLAQQRIVSQTVLHALLGKEYRYIEGWNRLQRPAAVSPDPTAWAGTFQSQASRFLGHPTSRPYEESYCFAMDCIDYFLSVLRFLEVDGQDPPRDWANLPEALSKARRRLAELQPLQQEFAASLHSAFMSDAAPKYLHERYLQEQQNASCGEAYE